MSETTAGARVETAPLPCSCIIYRAMLRKQWMNQETGQVSPAAFLRRPKGDEDGLSVNIAEHCAPGQCAAQFRNCYGVASLHTGRVRDIGLDVHPDSIDHACITGLPLPSANPLEAERLAGLLARQARPVPLDEPQS